MLIEFRSADRMLGTKALSIYAKALDAAVSACEKVYAPTLYLDGEKAKAEGAGDWLTEQVDEMGVGEALEMDMPNDLALTLRYAASVYLAQLTKLSEKQSDLLVPQEETNEVTSHVTSLADRLRGQIELTTVIDSVIDDGGAGSTRFPDTTASFNGGPPTTMENAARQMGEAVVKELRGRRGRRNRAD